MVEISLKDVVGKGIRIFGSLQDDIELLKVVELARNLRLRPYII